MDHFFALVQRVRPHRKFETSREKFFLGRSRDCDIVIPEPQVSRRQAEVWLENGRHYIRNLGRNLLRLNGRPTTGDFLDNGDEIAFGDSQYTYLAQAAAGDGSEAQTQLVSEPDGADGAQRLVCNHPNGRTTTHALIGERFLIGRLPEADLSLADPSVSRRHCLIERRGDDHLARNISAINPLAVNDRVVTEARLSSGDRLKIGPYVISFFSSRREDSRPRPRSLNRFLAPRRLAITGLAAAAAAAALFYSVGVPWKTAHELEAIAQRLSSGADAGVREELLPLLARDLSADHRQLAQRLWAQSTLEIARRRAAEGRLDQAIGELEKHIALPAAGAETAPLRELLHEYRLHLGRQLETGPDPQPALALYGAIPEESPHYTEARKSIHRLWQASQKELSQRQTVNQLLHEAEILFGAQSYLTPLRQNAYSLYQAVLAIEPGNAAALKRIDEIKAHYRSEGEKRFKAGEWSLALTAFERYCLIDPEAADVRQKMSLCNRRLAQPEASAAPKAAATKRLPADAAERRRVERLLEESGAQSPWIIKYLFDEKPRSDGSETPW